MFHLRLLSEALSPVLGSPPGERHLSSEMSPLKGHKAGQRAEACGIQGNTETSSQENR